LSFWNFCGELADDVTKEDVTMKLSAICIYLCVSLLRIPSSSAQKQIVPTPVSGQTAKGLKVTISRTVNFK
jgi:hypothetical protein